MILEPVLPPVKPDGRPRTWPMRLIMDSIFSVVRSGCQRTKVLPVGPGPGSRNT
ncbi:MAG TPA: transposase [Chloroflexota bacterium]|nr:transposase [Chloroflexota bacterium]